MNAAQIHNQIFENSKGLPKEILVEILDFIQFLKMKKSKLQIDSLQSELSYLSTASEKHLEEEFADYKNIYQHE